MNFYFEASKLLDGLDAKQGSVMGVIATTPQKDRKRMTALLIETLKYKSILTHVIKESGLLKDERKHITTMNLALPLVHDVLMGGGIQAGDGPIKQAILRHKTRLHAELQKQKVKRRITNITEFAQTADSRAEKIPRYVRVNTLVWSLNEAIEGLQSGGFVLSDQFTSNRHFAKDRHIPNLLLFPPQTNFSQDSLLKDGKIIIQDKASCFPAVVLAPPAHKDAVVIDATAAPGNKTSHLSALMKGKGKILAFERDRKRFDTLKIMLAKARCTNVEAVNADFLQTSPEDSAYADVTHILLDPSCSGSGIINRLDYLIETDDNPTVEGERLEKLASFQLLMIRHAMKFEKVSRIVYSTCSIHAEENEHVVRNALASEEAIENGFILAPRQEVLPQWPRRGIEEELSTPDQAHSLIRCKPDEDATNGFFVSCFVRKSKASKRTEGGEPEKAPSKKKRKKRKD